jgi:tetratricopeptide (TPR) repeat protein
MKIREFILLLAVALLPTGSFAQTAPPLDQVEILGRLGVGYAPSYVAYLVRTRSVNFSPAASFIFQVESAGGRGVLVEELQSTDNSSGGAATDAATRTNAEQSVEHLAKCAEFMHIGDVDAAEQECRSSIAEHRTSFWPLLITLKLVKAPALQLGTESLSDVDKAAIAERADLAARATALGVDQLLAMRVAPGATMPPPGVTGEGISGADPEHLEISELMTLSADSNSPMSVFGRLANLPTDELFSAQASVVQPITIAPDLQSRIKIAPELASNHMVLAATYLDQGHDLAAAEREFREAVRLEPDSTTAHVLLGIFLLARKEEIAGISEFREAVRIAPSATLTHMMLAGAYETLGHTPEAISEMQTVLTLRPAEVDTSNALIELYMAHKDSRSAITELRRSLKASAVKFTDQRQLVETRKNSFGMLANLLKGNHQLDEAGEVYVYMLQFRPNDAGIHNDYGNVLLDQNRLDEALGEYNEALRLDPEMSTAHNNIGLCLVRRKNLDGAIKEFRQALELNPDEPHTQIYLGTALGQQGDLNGANEQFAQAIAKTPNDPGSHMGLAYAYDQLKNAAGEIGELKRALELDPESAEAQNDLAWIYVTAEDLKLRKPANALELARKAVTADPTNAAFVDTLAEALLLNGKEQEALDTERKAVALAPENLELQGRLARFREAAGVAEEPPKQ